MSNKKPVKGSDPTATGQATDRQKELEKFQMISANTFHALVKEGNPFYAMRQLNASITNKILGSLIDELILLRDEANPITVLKTKPLQAVWSAFFESYDGKTAKTLTNQANPSQSYRNMLATFPSKIKSIMKELVNQGLVTQWQVTSTKKSLLEEWQVAQLDAFLQEKGVLNPSMEISMRYSLNPL